MEMKITSLGMEAFMHGYEIRILSAGHTIAVIEEMHFNDHGAVRSAKKIAGDRRFEVWRGLDCIYGTDNTSREPKTGRSLSL
jgi:hypothetical protein